MKSNKKIKGFNYIRSINEDKTSDEWKIILKDAIAAGGFRRAESGETFIHGSDGLIVYEIYSVIQAPK